MKRWGLLVSIVCAVGCGDDGSSKGHLADAPRVEDAATGDAVGEVAPVTVVVTVNGQPKSGVQVYFQNADSSLALDTKTGDDGKAQLIMAAGGFATVIEPDVGQDGSGSGGGMTEVATFAGVKPGDVLHDDLQPLNTESTGAALTITVPNEGLGHSYTVYTSCGQQFVGVGEPPVAVKAKRGKVASAVVAGLSPITADATLYGCNGTADALLVATNSDGFVTGWQYKSAVEVKDDGNITFDGAYQAPVDTEFSYTKVPANLNSFDIRRDLYTARGTLYSKEVNAEAGDGGASATLTLPAPQGVSALTTTVSSPSSGAGRITIAEWGAALSTYAVAYGDLALSQFQTQPAFNVDAHSMTWTEQAGVAADFVVTSYFNSRTDDQERNHAWRWRLAAPYAAGKAVFPVLPVGDFDYNPKTEDQGLNVEQLITAKLPGGYDAARGYALEGMPSNYTPPSELGASGQTIFQNLAFLDVRQQPTVKAPKRLSPAAH